MSKRRPPSRLISHTTTRRAIFIFFFFFNDTPPPEIYPLSLHDALPICGGERRAAPPRGEGPRQGGPPEGARNHRTGRAQRMGATQARPTQCGSAATRCDCAGSREDRKSTRLNSSHLVISYAVFCLKKKK